MANKWNDDFKNALGNIGTFDLKLTFSGANVANMLKGGLFSKLSSTFGNIMGNAISGGLLSEAGSAVNSIGGTVGSAISTVNPILGGIVSGGSGILGGAVNSVFGSKLNKEKINEIEGNISAMNTVQVDNSSSDSVMNQWANLNFGSDFTKSDIGKDGLFSNKASNKYKKLKLQQASALNRALTAFEDAAIAADTTTDLNAAVNYAAKGGQLHTHGAIWDNGITTINNGSTHENNPYEGVPMGVDNQGIPNLVEQGEVIFNDYVFSNRLTVPDTVRNKYKLRGNKELTFADAAKQISKESEERPNDPISKRGLDTAMKRLMQELEIIRLNMANKELKNKYAYGGKKGRMYKGTGPYPNFLNIYDENETPYKDSDILGYTKRGVLMNDSNIVPSYLSVPNYSSSIVNSTSTNKGDKDDKGNNNSNLTWLRYAPALGAAIGLGQNLLSKPDYSNADKIEDAANNAGNYTSIGYTPIGNYLTYNPFDTNYYLNKLNALAGATRRAIMNTTSPSRDASLLAADYNILGKLGDLARQAEEYNLAQRQAVEQFNRGTAQANAEMGLKAAMANQEAQLKARQTRLSGLAQAMSMRDAIDARRSAGISANLTNLFSSLGDIGREEYSRNMIMSNPALYYSIDSKGNISYKNGYESLSEAEKKEVRDAANKANKKKANGGYLIIKKGGSK